MNKPVLEINKNDIANPLMTLGMTEFLRYLEGSQLFDVKYHNLSIKAMRCERAAIVLFNGKKIYLDFWEYNTPTYSEEVYDYNFDLIIKLQHKQMDDARFLKTCHKRNILTKRTDEEKIAFSKKIVPWTFFCSRPIYKYLKKNIPFPILPVEQLGFFCGKMWRCRKKWTNKLIKEKFKVIESNNELKCGRIINDEEYAAEMIKSKYGIIIKGRSSHLTEGKNRREIDYMILKKPLLMNYKPFYYNPLIPGKHFIYFDENTSLQDLESKYNMNEIVNAASEWYENNASPEGVVKVFVQIMKDKGFC